MTKRTIRYRAVWQPVEFRPEWLEAQAKRQTELYMRMRELDDALEASQRRYQPSLTYIPLIMGGAVLGAITGAIIGWTIVGRLLH